LGDVTPDTAHALDLAARPGLAEARRDEPAPPRPRPSMVPRTALVRRLLACRDTPVAIVTAPAGYGKTTLLAGWGQRADRPFAWPDGRGDGIGAGRWAGEYGGAAARRGERVVTEACRLIDDAAATGRPRVIVLDDAQALPRTGLTAALRAAARLPDGAVL